MILLGATVSIITVLIVSSYLLHALEQEAVESWHQRTAPLVQSLATRVELELQQARNILQMMAGLPQFRQPPVSNAIDHSVNGVPEFAEQEKRRLLQLAIDRYSSFSVLFMLTGDGRHYLAQPYSMQRLAKKQNMRDRPYFQDARRTRDLVISDSFTGADGMPVVVINTPVEQDDGNISAHLGGVYHLPRLAALLQQLDDDVFDELLLLDGKGALIAHNDPRWITPWQRDSYIQRASIRQLQSSRPDQVGDEINFQLLAGNGGESEKLAFSVLLNSGWRLIALRDRSAVVDSVQPRSIAITITTALILLCISGFGLIIVNAIGKRWERAELSLKEAKQRLEAEVRLQTGELTASRDHIELLLSSSGAGIFGIDTTGHCTFFNSACTEILGVAPDQALLGRHIDDLAGPHDRYGQAYEDDNSPIFEAIRQDRQMHIEHALFCTREDYCIPVEFRASPMRQEGSVVGAVVTFNDISDRIRAQQAQADTDASVRSAELKLQHTNTLLRAVIDQAPFAITLVEGSTDDWSVTLANQEAQRITGANAEIQRKIHFVEGELVDPLNRTWQTRKPDGTGIDLCDTPLVQAMATRRITRNKEMIIRRADGQETYVLGNAAPIYDADGEQIAAIFTYPDITELKQKEETINTLSQAMEQSPVSVVITNPEGMIEYTNRGFERSTGYSSEEIRGQHTRLLGSGNTSAKIYASLWQSITGGEAWQGEFQNRRKDGALFWEYAHISPIFDSLGRIRHFLAVKEDITLRKEQEEKILHQAHFDSLTGLPNRFLSLDRLSQIIRMAQREQQQAAVLFLDLDDFKKVNDTLGHEVGDQVIQEAAKRISGLIREEDTVGRLGGDEFIVLLSNLHDREDASKVAEKILNVFRTVFRLNDREVLLTTSIGISIFPDNGETAKILLRNADTAMYHSKAVGRNAYHHYTEAMNQDVARRMELEEQLHGALANGEFYLHYQPIVNIHSQALVGAEALLRWNNPKLGQISPVEFIEIAERTGRIVEIGEYVMHTAVEQARRWLDQSRRPIRIAVNVSPVQFKDRHFLSMVSGALEQHDLPGHFLEIEVTENVLLSDKIDVVELLSGLRELGISISMDDFGTGYSSLSYLRHYPFDTLKVDRSFVRDITTDPEDRELVIATISMARSLGLKVIAEGVETAEQLAILQTEKCDFGQGYYFSKPVSATALARLFLS